jgi:Uma2 family endonuclease
MKNILDIPRTAMEVFNMLPEGTRCEVIDNTLYMSPSPTSDHQDILGDIFFKIKQSVIQNQSGKVFISPLDVYLDNELSVVQPDILFVKTEHLHLIQRKGIVGSPDMVIEVLSSNKDYDIGKKFELYEKNHISEYIIINPDTKEVWHYILNGNKYETIPSENGVLNSTIISTQITF